MEKKDAPRQKIKKSRIVAIICSVMALLGFIIYITESSAAGESLPPTIIFGIIAIVFWCISFSSPKLKDNVFTNVHSLCDPDEPSSICSKEEAFAIDDVSSIDGMDGHDFEYFCADLLRKDGFSEVNVTRGSGDQGVDILATKGGIKYAIQCKNYSSAVGNKPVQEVSAGRIFYNCHVGVVLTNSTFTQGAISLANATGVLLWDRNVLSQLMKVKQLTDENAHQKVVESAHVSPRPQIAVQSSKPKMSCVTSAPIRSSFAETSDIPVQKKKVEIDNITIEVDAQSFSYYNIVLDNFGIEMDVEEDENSLEFLFDVMSKCGSVIPHDVDIVCNLYAGRRKIITERETVYKDSFRNRDSRSIYFDKKRICKIITGIELYCQKW